MQHGKSLLPHRGSAKCGIGDGARPECPVVVAQPGQTPHNVGKKVHAGWFQSTLARAHATSRRDLLLSPITSPNAHFSPQLQQRVQRKWERKGRERGDSRDGEAGKEGTEDWAEQVRAFKCAELRCAAKFSEGGEEGGGADPQMQSGQSRGPLRLLDVFQLPIVFFCRRNPTELHRH